MNQCCKTTNKEKTMNRISSDPQDYIDLIEILIDIFTK